MKISYELAQSHDLVELSELVCGYHNFESINLSNKNRQSALIPLLESSTGVGFILMAKTDERIVGYIALCFGYTIEFGGRDAMVDELYVLEEMRGNGIGSSLLNQAKRAAVKNGVNVLHLEVANTNDSARNLYANHGFSSREKYHLMSCTLSSKEA